MTISSRARLVSILAAGMLALAGTGTAFAGVQETGKWENPIHDTACDAGYVVDGREWGHSRILDPTAAEPEFFRFANWYNGHTTVTNPATGASFSEEWSGRFWEHSITRTAQPGYVYTYETTDMGWYKVRDGAGKLVFQARGEAVFSYLFDAVGDGSVGAPGGTYLEDPVEVSNTFDQTFDFCAFADDLIG